LNATVQEFRPAAEFGRQLEDLQWIDGFVDRIRPYVRVRLEDGVLIKVPTEVYKLNASGLRLLHCALAGEGIAEVAAGVGATGYPERLSQIHAFFCDVRDLLSGELGAGQGRRATAVKRFTGSFTAYPVLSELAVTYRCNLSCVFCYAGCGTAGACSGNPGREKRRWRWPGRRGRAPREQEMTADEVLRVIDEIAGPGRVPSISFTGGEATLRPELPSFIARARDRGLRVNLITNGVRCASEPYVRELEAAGLNSAQVSVEGPNAAIHDRIVRREGAFDRTRRGVENLQAAGITVHTHTTISRDNADHLAGIIDLAAELGLPRVSMNMVIPTGTPNLPQHAALRMRYDEIGEPVLLAREHARERGVAFLWYSPTPFCLFNPIARGLGHKGCAACDGLLHVSPTGEVLPCSSFATGVGNLLELGFDAVWFGKDAEYYRSKRMAPLVCRTCDDFALCQGACTLYWSGMGKKELYKAWLGKTLGLSGASQPGLRSRPTGCPRPPLAAVLPGLSCSDIAPRSAGSGDPAAVPGADPGGTEVQP